MAKESLPTEVSVVAVDRGYVEFCLLGRTPLIFHRMSEKVKRYLILPPPGKKTAADKAATLKHDPLEEYRSSVYLAKKDLDNKTHLVFPGRAFKQAISDAALDLPGLKKAQIGRLCGVEEFDVSVFGIPALHMKGVRNSDMNHTPDIRTRACCENWAAKLTVSYTKPLVKQADIVNLVAAAGVFIGIGDDRQQKGGGSHGLWDIVAPTDARFQAVVKHGGAEAQKAALEHPAMYDDETADLYNWYNVEIRRRGEENVTQMKPRASKKAKTSKLAKLAA